MFSFYNACFDSIERETGGFDDGFDGFLRSFRNAHNARNASAKRERSVMESSISILQSILSLK
jgi:hypothetical protein